MLSNQIKCVVSVNVKSREVQSPKQSLALAKDEIEIWVANKRKNRSDYLVTKSSAVVVICDKLRTN